MTFPSSHLTAGWLVSWFVAWLALPLAELQGTVQPLPPLTISQAGWSVRLESLAAPDQTWHTVTDEQGQFRFTSLPAGTYYLTVAPRKHLEAGRYVYVAPQQVTFCNLRPTTAALRGLFTLLGSGLLILLLAAALLAIFLLSRPGKELLPLKVRFYRLLLGGGIWAGTFLLLAFLAPHFHPQMPTVATFLSAWGGALLAGALLLSAVQATLHEPEGAPSEVSLSPRLAQLVTPLWSHLGLLALGGVLLLLLDFAFSQSSLPRAWQALGIGLTLLGWTFCAGVVLSHGLRQADYLVITAIVVALADVYSVYYGPTGEVVKKVPEVVSLMILAWPVWGTNLLHPIIGAGDFLFLTLFLEAARRFNLGLSKNYWGLMGAFGVGLALAHFGRLPLPALPFIGLTFLFLNWSRIRPERRAWRRILWFCGGMLLFFLTLVILQRGGW